MSEMGGKQTLASKLNEGPPRGISSIGLNDRDWRKAVAIPALSKERLELTSAGGKCRQAQGVEPMQNAPIHEALAEALSACAYDQLTPVQSAVITDEAESRDLIVSAK